MELRQELFSAGHDAGAQTIAHHLAGRVDRVPSVATIWRILSRHGLITPQPHKRPRCSFKRFEAQLPNEMWQADSTHWQLADGTDVEILNLIDDHSGLVLASCALPSLKAPNVYEIFLAATQAYGVPAALLCDNAAVFSGSPRRGKVVIEAELERRGIRCIHSTPYHPQTCGKVERFHQTLKRFLARQTSAPSLAHLQLQLDAFRSYYNQQRPHRALDGRSPLSAFNARLKARPDPAQLGHKTLAMTMVCARIADKTVAEEYFAVSEKVESLNGQPRHLPAEDEGTEMRKLRAEMHRRMLGNGYCARPVGVDRERACPKGG